MSAHWPTWLTPLPDETLHWRGRMLFIAAMGSKAGFIILLALILTAIYLVGFILSTLHLYFLAPVLQWIFWAVLAITVIYTIAALIWAALTVLSTEYVITSHRACAKRGLVGREVVEIGLDWISAVIFKQSDWGRLLDYGDVSIAAPGLEKPLTFRGVRQPDNVKTTAHEAARRLKERRKIEEDLRHIEREYLMGRIPQETYKTLKTYYEQLLHALG